MARLKLTVAYVGTALHGWQLQAHEDRAQPRTVQGEIERIVSRMAGIPVRVHGAGRTDSGVHADAQVAHMDVPEERAGMDWQKALNAQLPDDISVIDVTRVPDTFHARFDASGKRYTYRLWLTRRFIPPRIRAFVWATGPLDVYAMDRAASHMTGTHDFASFQNHGTDITTTIRTVHAIRRTPAGTLPEAALLPHDGGTGRGHEVRADGKRDDASPPLAGLDMELVWSFEGDGFLKQMVRNMMGLLVTVGRGKLDADEVPAIMAACDRRRSAVTAPAWGLTLAEVHYPPFDYPYRKY